jgi:hypothetical protein
MKFARFLSQTMSYADAVEVFRSYGAGLHERDYIDLLRRHRGSAADMRRINAAGDVLKNVLRDRRDPDPAPEPSRPIDDAAQTQGLRPGQSDAREGLRGHEPRNYANGAVRLRTRRTGVPRPACDAPPFVRLDRQTLSARRPRARTLPGDAAAAFGLLTSARRVARLDWCKTAAQGVHQVDDAGEQLASSLPAADPSGAQMLALGRRATARSHTAVREKPDFRLHHLLGRIPVTK